jgi:hypothetical protein
MRICALLGNHLPRKKKESNIIGLRKRVFSAAAVVAMALMLVFGPMTAAPVSAEQTDANASTRLPADKESQNGQVHVSTEAKPAPKAPGCTWFAMGEKLPKDQAGTAAPTSGGGTDAHKGHSLEEINNKLNNPGTDLAQLNFKFIWNQYEGDLPGSSSQDSLTLQFQPVVPFKLPDGGNLILRPTIPLVWQPNFNASKGGFGEQFGLGDSQLNVFYSRTNVKKGYMWGLGAVMQAPTHTDDVLGKDQFQMGPAGFAGLMGKWGSAGVFPQHLWNVGGSGEGYTALTVVQPWYWFSVGKGWQVGGSPIITYDWSQDDSDQAWTVPVNLGVAKTIMVGRTPVKLKLEAIYYIVQPDAFGPHWGLQLTVTPVVPNVFAGLFK